MRSGVWLGQGSRGHKKSDWEMEGLRDGGLAARKGETGTGGVGGAASQRRYAGGHGWDADAGVRVAALVSAMRSPWDRQAAVWAGLSKGTFNCPEVGRA